MVFITIVTGAYKPTYILGPHIVAFPGVQHFYSTLRSLKIDTFATKRSRKHPALTLLGHTVSGDVLINLHWWQMASPIPIGSMYALYMVTFTINIPPMLVYIPYMDPMGYEINQQQLEYLPERSGLQLQ
jgi:hypothetical protein